MPAVGIPVDAWNNESPEHAGSLVHHAAGDHHTYEFVRNDVTVNYGQLLLQQVHGVQPAYLFVTRL